MPYKFKDLSQFTLIYGPMFAGKTSYLLHKCSTLKKSLVFKPTTDKRSPKNKIKSHTGIEYNCIDVDFPDEILAHIDSNITTICIDELQFFAEGIVGIIKFLLAKNINIIASGLLLDSNDTYFGCTKALLAIAHNKIELYSTCNICSKPASHTIRKDNFLDLIHPGGEEFYTTYCTVCKHNKRN